MTGMFQSRSERQRELAARFVIRVRPVFMTVLSTSLFMLVFLIIFPRLSRAEANADADHGKQLFEKRCTGCHSLDKDKEGPRLRGVYGRQAGKVSSYNYSEVLQSSGITWDDVSLNKWLTDPESMVAGTDMSFRVTQPDERAEIIHFLKAVSLQSPPSEPVKAQ